MNSPKFNRLKMAVLRQVSLRIGLEVQESDSNQLLLAADASIPSRGIGLWIILLSLLPFHSDLLVESGNTSFLNGYDWYNHLALIPLRLALTLPGLWIFLVYGKVTRCTFDKNKNIFVVEQKNYLFNERSEGTLQDISALKISHLEKSVSSWFGKDSFAYIEVKLLRDSKEPVSFTFIERKSEIDSAIVRVQNLLSEFLDLE